MSKIEVAVDISSSSVAPGVDMLEISLVSMEVVDNNLSGLRMYLMTLRAEGNFKSMLAMDLAVAAMKPFSNVIRVICC